MPAVRTRRTPDTTSRTAGSSGTARGRPTIATLNCGSRSTTARPNRGLPATDSDGSSARRIRRRRRRTVRTHVVSHGWRHPGAPSGDSAASVVESRQCGHPRARSVDQRCTASAGRMDLELVGLPDGVGRRGAGDQGAGDTVAHAGGAPGSAGGCRRTPHAPTARCPASDAGSPRAPSPRDSCW